MVKFILDRPGAPWDYPTLGFSADADGAILDGTLFDPDLTIPPDSRWTVYGGGSAETDITRYAVPSSEYIGSVIPETAAGWILAYDPDENTYVGTDPASVVATEAWDAGIATLVTDPLVGVQTIPALSASTAAFIPSRYSVRRAGALGLGADEHVAILSTIEDAENAGGGIVQFAAGDYNMAGFSLPTPNGVHYEFKEGGQTQEETGGVNYAGNFLSHWDETGTRLRGDGTAPGITDGHVGAGSYAADMDATASKGFGIHGGVWLEDFTVALKCGAQNRMGITYSNIDAALYVDKSCGASVEMWNFQELDLRYLMDGGTLGGPLFGADIAPFVPGNSRLGKIYRMLPSVVDAGGADAIRKYRGIRLVATAGSVLNEVILDFPQSTGYNVTELSVSGTVTSGSANITVPDGTKFAVGMIVRTTGDATWNGTDNRAYVVKSVAGNVITLAYSLGQSALVSGGNGTVAFTTRGYASLEVVGSGDITASEIRHADLEGDRVGAYIEKMRGTFGLYEVPAAAATSLIIRNSQLEVFSGGIATTNMDSNSLPLCGFHGRLGDQEWSTGHGNYYDEDLATRVNLP